MPKIVTAHIGKKHITSDDVSSLQQAIIGKDDYLLSDNPDLFTAHQTDMSTIQLSKAEVVVQGTHIRILNTDKVTIDAGQSGFSRIDVIAVAYSKTEEGIENAEIKVVKGDFGVKPVAPQLTQSDIRNGGFYHEMALFNVNITDASISSITRVCKNVKTLSYSDNVLMQNTADIADLKESINNIQRQNVLWSGSLLMNANDKAVLNKSVSSTTHGIVLVFSAYNGTETKDYDFHTFFLPKYQVEMHSGAGSRFNMVNNWFSYFASKYLYISNDQITGNTENISVGSKNGIRYNNSNFVLRYVIGV